MTRVREATIDDARAIAEVHVAGWRWAYRSQIPDEFIDGLTVEGREEHWRRSIGSPGRGVIVAEADDTIVGFAGFGAPEDPEGTEGTGEVHAIYLRPDVAGRGIGRRLFAEANDGLRDAGFRRAFLWVLETNDRARRFYEKAGWAWDGTTSTHRFDCAERPVVRYVADL